MGVVLDRDGQVVAAAPQRSTPLDAVERIDVGNGGVELVGGRIPSYARLVSEQPWAWIAITRLLTWATRVPLKLYRRGDDSHSRQRVRPGQHRLADSLHTPWPGAGTRDLVLALLAPHLVHGNAVMPIEDGPRSIRWDPTCDVRQMRAVTDVRGAIRGWERTIRGDVQDVEPWDAYLHIKTWSPLSTAVGMPALHALQTTFTIEDAARRWQIASLRNSGRPPSAVKASAEWLGIAEPERSALLDKLRSQISEIYTGPENAGRPALLPPGLEWENIGHTAVEAELIDQRACTREEIAAAFFVPPPMIGILADATLNNMEVLRQVAYGDGLGPPLVAIESGLNALLITHLLREPDLYVEFDFAGVLRGDRLKEIQALREGVAGGLLTPNEGRDVLNLPRVAADDANRLHLPTNNLTPLGGSSDRSAAYRLQMLRAAPAGRALPNPDDEDR